MNESQNTHDLITNFNEYTPQKGDALEGPDGKIIESGKATNCSWYGWMVDGAWWDATIIAFAREGLVRIWRPKPVPTLDDLERDGWTVNRADDGRYVAVRFAANGCLYVIHRDNWANDPRFQIASANALAERNGGWQGREVQP